jgi:hypothetical protein
VDRPELDVRGVPETALSHALLSRLPQNVATAPWTVRCDGVVWTTRGGSAATAALPPALRTDVRGLLVVGGFVRYVESPVGPYDEAFGMVVARTGGSLWGAVAFMAVDSEASLVAGRTNWALPKTLAAFTGDPGSTITARGSDTSWRVGATSSAGGPAVPFRAKGLLRQELSGGSVRDSLVAARGRSRPALVRVDVVSGGSLSRWLRPGRRLGALLSDVAMTMEPPGISPGR